MAKDILQNYITTRKALEVERTRLQARLKELKRALDGETPAPSVKVSQPGKAAKPVTQPVKAPSGGKRRAPRGQLKAKILAELKAAGKGGITFKDLAGKLGAGSKRLYKWFYTTGKAVPGLKKIGKGKYRLEA